MHNNVIQALTEDAKIIENSGTKYSALQLIAWKMREFGKDRKIGQKK